MTMRGRVGSLRKGITTFPCQPMPVLWLVTRKCIFRGRSFLSRADVGGYVSPAVAARDFEAGLHHVQIHRVVVVASVAAVGLKPVEERLHVDIQAATGGQVAL